MQCLLNGIKICKMLLVILSAYKSTFIRNPEITAIAT